MLKNIEYKQRVWAIGRNGSMIQTGISLFKNEAYGDQPEKFMLNPINTRCISNTEIQLPIENVEEFCLSLLKMSGKLQSFCESHFNIDNQ